MRHVPQELARLLALLRGDGRGTPVAGKAQNRAGLQGLPVLQRIVAAHFAFVRQNDGKQRRDFGLREQAVFQRVQFGSASRIGASAETPRTCPGPFGSKTCSTSAAGT